ncbi:MAG: hypothetical protein ABJA67_14465 [Chthonomonadales bacterium]
MADMERRGFLGAMAASAASFGMAALVDPALANPEMMPVAADSEFDAWLNKIKGKHRQVYDAPDTHEGMPLAWARVFLMSNAQVGVAEDDMTSVLILRHNAIPIAMQSPLWEKFKFGETFKVTDKATGNAATRNPWHMAKPGELLLPDMTVEALLKSGVLIGVCDLALTVYSGVVGKAMNMDPVEVKKEWVAGLIPGVQRLPSGVLGVNRAQEHKCTYCFAG